MAPSRTQSHHQMKSSTKAAESKPIDEVKMRFQEVVHLVDSHLSQYPLITQAAQSIGMRPSWIPIAVLIIISMLFGVFDNLITNIIGFFYPAWQSFKAIESPSALDDRQWLTYWVVYAFFSFLEIFGDFLLFWVPFYYLVKVCFLLWLFLPQFKGASIIYSHMIRPILIKYEQHIDQALGQALNGDQCVEGSLNDMKKST